VLDALAKSDKQYRHFLMMEPNLSGKFNAPSL